MKPMLARTYGPKFSQFPCYVQPKLNGVRALWQAHPIEANKVSTGVFQSRDEKLWNDRVVSHLNQELSFMFGQSAILDGELYVHGWKLQRINSAIAVKRLEPSPDTPHVCFHVFDVVDPTRPFSERWIPMRNLLAEANLQHVRPVDTSMVHDSDQLQRYFHMCTAEGYEGVMLRPDGPYEFGVTDHGTQKRSRFLWKHKQWEDAEFECVGITEGEGKASIGIGALVLSAYNETSATYPKTNVPSFNVGTGFSDEERWLFGKNPPIGKLVRVRYLCLSEDGIPLNPSFLAVLE